MVDGQTSTPGSVVRVPLGRGRMAGNVCFGSLADIVVGRHHVRFTPKSGHRSARWRRLLCARSGHSV
jgi:hypothetical protein